MYKRKIEETLRRWKEKDAFLYVVFVEGGIEIKKEVAIRIAASFFCKSLINRGEDYGLFLGRLMNGYPVIYTLKVLANLYFENFSASKSDKSPKILPYSSIIILPSRQSNFFRAILRNNVFVVDSYCQILSHS